MRGDEARIADYLLGELPETERAAVELRIARDPAFAESVERMRAVVEGLGAVPPGGWPSDAPSGAPPLPPLPGLSRPRQPAWRALRPAQAVAIAIAPVAVGVAIGVLVSRAATTRGHRARCSRSRASATPVPPPGARRGWSAATRPACVSTSAAWRRRTGPTTSRGSWTAPTGSLGSFRVPASGRAEIDVPLPVPVADFRYIDVSREPDDGNPSHSGDSVLRGSTGGA